MKRKAVEQVETKTREAEHLNKAIKMETEANKIKGQIEDMFLRFPHIGEQILEKLEDDSLSKCQKVSKPWKDFITKNKVWPIEVLRKNTMIPKARLKKTMHKHELKIVQKLANCAINECKGMATHEITPRVRQAKLAKLIHNMLFYKKIDSIQYLLIKLILQNIMDTNDTKSADQALNNLNEALHMYRKHYMVIQIFWVGYSYYYEKQEVVSWSNILLIATFNGHFSICKFIIEIIKDVHKASTWGETLIAIANLNGHHDVSKLLKNAF